MIRLEQNFENDRLIWHVRPASVLGAVAIQIFADDSMHGWEHVSDPDHHLITFQTPSLRLNLSIPPHCTDDTSDSVRLIRVRNQCLLLPRLVLDTPTSVHCGRDQGPDLPAGLCYVKT